MDKETPAIEPTNLEASPSVKTADPTSEAATEEKEKAQDYYVDPLEQEARMEEKRKQMEQESAEKKAEGGSTEDEEEAPIRPDLNVDGFFSNGSTAKKASGQPASASMTKVAFFISLLNVTYAIFFAVMLIATGFDSHWIMSLIYAYVVGASLFAVMVGLRAKNSNNEEVKKQGLFCIIFSGISIIPIFMLIIGLLLKG